jgi:hypothetical protein
MQELLENVSIRHLPKHNIEKGFHVTVIYPLDKNLFVKPNFYPPMSVTEFAIRRKDQPRHLQIPRTIMKKEYQLYL